jgi:hypothetical protein
MNRRLLVVLLGGCILLVVGVAVAKGPSIVRDFYGEAVQDLNPSDPYPAMTCGSLSVDAGLAMQTVEPAQGFTGACLMNLPYSATLPTVCYSPVNANYSPGASSQCTIAAASDIQPDWYINANQKAGTVTREYLYESYRVLETCAPRLAQPDPSCTWSAANRNCPCNTVSVSNSCCTHYGTAMSSPDNGRTATGTAYFAAQ